MRVCIDAGHGGKDAGAVNGNIYEKNITLDVSIMLADILKSKGINVYLTRDNDIYDSPTVKAQKANRFNVNLFVSIHCNSVANPSANGTEVLIYGNDNKNEVVASNIASEISKNLKINNRGIKIRKDLTVLSKTGMTAVLVELAFLSNDNEKNLLINRQKDFAKSIANGIFDYFGIEKGDEEMVEKSEIIVDGKKIVVDRILKDGYNFIKIRDIADALNFEISNQGDIPVLNKK